MSREITLNDVCTQAQRMGYTVTPSPRDPNKLLIDGPPLFVVDLDEDRQFVRARRPNRFNRCLTTFYATPADLLNAVVARK